MIEVMAALVTSTSTVLLVTPSLKAVTVVLATAFPDNTPVGVTVAVCGSSEVQVTESLTSDEVPSL
ncbi:conserved hypothetical protein [Vibrio crassostreae]|nr:conserved hypothetical protein [Vibrio crassostreae]